ncbi:hypothetical protein B0H10DRAFT_2193298, partial [Mycena sp. CBHHK59/15]
MSLSLSFILLLTVLVSRCFAGSVGNITNILPQCQDLCVAYNVMNTNCENFNVFKQDYIACECTTPNFKIIEDCFNCQSVNATEEDTFQDVLDAIVDNCNDRFGSPGSTISIAPQKIVPTVAFGAGPASGTSSGNPSSNMGHLGMWISVP